MKQTQVRTDAYAVQRWELEELAERELPFHLRQTSLYAACGLTQEQLAFDAGISRNYVSLLELNEKSPTVDLLLRLCGAMGTSAVDNIRNVEAEQCGE